MEKFVQRFDLELYTLKYHFLDQMVCELQRFGTLSALGSSLNDHFNVQIKHLYEKTSKMRKTRIMENVNVTEGGYQSTLQC